MRRQAILLLPVLMGLSMFGAAPLMAQSNNENVLVFSEEGEFLGSYHEGDYTTLIDATDVTYEEYSPGSPPTVSGGGMQPYTFTPGEVWVPNELDGIFPTPAGGLPRVSLYSFDEAVFSFDNPGQPGITVSPASGTFNHTVDVLIQAYPASAVVEIFDEDNAVWDTFGNTRNVIIPETRTLLIRSDDGGTKSPERMVTYQINQPPDVDTDKDTIPDVIEILLERFDPLVADAKKDSDDSGFTDLDELLRGSDPDDTDSDGDGWSDNDEESMGTDRLDETDSPVGPPPPYNPPLEPIDTDDDLWSDLDEGWRQTDENDPFEFPTARNLYEVEMLADGQFTGVPAVPVGATRRFKITENDNPKHIDMSLGSNSFVGARWPRGSLSLIRLALQTTETVENATKVNNTWSARRLMRPVDNPSPADIPSASWYAMGSTTLVADWFAAWADLLSKTLLLRDNSLEVNPEDTSTVALFETMYSYVGGLEPMTSYLLGRDGNNPDGFVLQEVRDRQAHPPSLVPPAPPVPLPSAAPPSIADLFDTMVQIQDQVGATAAVMDTYAAYMDGDDLELAIAEAILPVTTTYPAVIALSLTYQDMLDSGFPLADVLSATVDLDFDCLPNFVEALGYMNGWETNIFVGDSDGDGVVDTFDNCPTQENPDQLDNDSDGYGDACDPDDDNDGIEDALEEILMSDPFVADTDGDGWNDGNESDMGQDANSAMDSIFQHDNIEANSSFAVTSFTQAQTASPRVFASMSSFNSGVVVQPDIRNLSLTGLELRAEKDPGNPAALGNEQLSYLAMNPGPAEWNVGTLVTTGDWQDVIFDFPYPIGTQPLVIATIISEVDSTTFHVEVDEIGSASFRVRIRSNSSVPAPGTISERVAWFAIEAGETIPMGGESGEILAGAAAQPIVFDTPYTDTPTILVTVEGEEVHTVVDNADASGFEISLQTDFANGSPAGDHRVSWVALGTPVCLDPDKDGVCSAEDNAPTVYNPDQLDSDGDGFANIVEWLAGSDPFNPSSTPSMNNAQALIDLIEMGATPQELFEFAQMWMEP